MITNIFTPLEQFRQGVYHSFDQRADATLELLDALSGNTHARSVVELSLAPGFRRTYSSVYLAVGQCFRIAEAEQRRRREQVLLGLIAPYLAHPQQRKFWLFGLDATSLPRVFARTLADRGFVHCPNAVGGNKPITIGRQYAWLAYLPEKTARSEPAWVVPLIVRRIPTQETDLQVGVAQVAALLSATELPFHDALCVAYGDTRYSSVAFLNPLDQHPNLVTIARLRSTRTLYRQAPPRAEPLRRRGHPTWYGQPFVL